MSVLIVNTEWDLSASYCDPTKGGASTPSTECSWKGSPQTVDWLSDDIHYVSATCNIETHGQSWLPNSQGNTWERRIFFFLILSQLDLLGSEGEKLQEKIRLRENSVMCIFGWIFLFRSLCLPKECSSSHTRRQCKRNHKELSSVSPEALLLKVRSTDHQPQCWLGLA